MILWDEFVCLQACWGVFPQCLFWDTSYTILRCLHKSNDHKFSIFMILSVFSIGNVNSWLQDLNCGKWKWQGRSETLSLFESEYFTLLRSRFSLSIIINQRHFMILGNSKSYILVQIFYPIIYVMGFKPSILMVVTAEIKANLMCSFCQWARSILVSLRRIDDDFNLSPSWFPIPHLLELLYWDWRV